MGYSPIIGRFVNRDPEQYTDGYNLYQTENSNPIDNVDPFGTDSSSTTRPTAPPTTRSATPEEVAAERDAMIAAARKHANIWTINGNCACEAQKIIDDVLGEMTPKHWRLRRVEGWKWGHGGIVPIIRYHNVAVAIPKDQTMPFDPFIMDFWNKDSCGKSLLDWLNKWHMSTSDQTSRDGWDDVNRYYGQPPLPKSTPPSQPPPPPTSPRIEIIDGPGGLPIVATPPR